MSCHYSTFLAPVARKDRSIGKQKAGKDSPLIRFANADTDEKLIAFVRTFGPVVAKSTHLHSEPQPILTAQQEMQELRNERSIYHAALALVMELRRTRDFDYLFAQRLIEKIASNISDWPRQWEREQLHRNGEPFWGLATDSLKRIQQLSFSRPDMLLPPSLDARIVICELLNVFRATIFPNPLEMHRSIKYGIRPLLYSALRREFLYPHDVGICGNTQCRDFFEIERAGQQFCTPECSLRQRQREYWKKRGKKLRKKRLKKSN
jgi:hypothetical protein